MDGGIAIPFLLFWLTDFLRYMVTDLVVAAFELRRRWHGRTAGSTAIPAQAPLVSVVMAGFNEADTMPLTLASLAEQSWPNLEVIVIDDGSEDGTSDQVRAFLARHAGGCGPAPWCRLVTLRRRNGKAAALNLGLALARGEYIVYVDADTTFTSNAIFEIIRPMLEDPDCGAVGGNVVARNAAQNLLTQLVALEYLFSISVGRRFRSLVNMLHIISGAFGAFRRDVIDSVGGHTPTSGNDGDLTLKVRRVAKRLVFAERALCETKTPATLHALVKQRRRWDRNLVKNKLRRHRDLLDPRSTRFRLANALMIIDALVFNLVLGMRWIIVFTAVLWLAPEHLPRLLLLSYLIYVTADVFQLALAQWIQPTPASQRIAQWLHLPLYPLYKSFFRLVRLYSYIEEFGRQASYADVFAPTAVSRAALAYDNAGRMHLRQLLRALLWPWRRSAEETPP